MAKTANEEILDATVRHQIRLLRFSEGEAQTAAKLLAESDAELEALLKTELTDVSEARIRATLKEVRRLRTAVAERIQATLEEDMEGLAGTEASWEGEVLSSAVPVSMTFATVPPSVLKAVAGSPVNGIPLKGWLGKMTLNDVARIEQQIRLGVLGGETTDQLVRRIRGTKAAGYADGVASATRREAEMIARTATNHVSTAARQAVWNANADIIKGVRWVATLDGRTSAVCQSRDGEVYAIDKGPRPPAHPNCRSTVAPVLDGEEIVGTRPTITDKRTRRQREIDFRAEAHAEVGDAKWKAMTVAQRDAAIKARRLKWADENIGQAPTSTNYETWLRGQSKEFQDSVLGPTKAGMFRKGATLDKFVDANGKPYSLQQLKAELEGDKLHVVQPGVGLKAKSLLQQGFSNQEVLDQIKAEYPDASTSLASIASYKSELNKAGALNLPADGLVTPGTMSPAKLASNMVSLLDFSLPPNLKQAVGGQWYTIVDDLDGAPGAYGYYQAGKGVMLSGQKLAKLPAAQITQVTAHELGHLLHKQHDLVLPDDVLASMKASAKALTPDARKLYSYYLSSPDELLAEIYAQALSPSALTSQGLSAFEFNAAFKGSIEAAKKAMADKFPSPGHSTKAPMPGGPTAPYEVAGKHTTVGSLAKALLQQGMPDEMVLKSVLAEFPDAKTKMASIQSYKSQLKKDGLLANKSAGPVVTAKPAPDVAPVPSAASIAAPDLDNLAPSTVKAPSAAVKDFGISLMQKGVLDNKAIAEALQKQFPLNDNISLGSIATWKTLWKKANPEEFAKASKLAETTAVKESTSGPLAKPKLYGVQLGSFSSTQLEKVKALLAGGGTQAQAHDLLKAAFGSYDPAKGSDLIELATYQLHTAKAAGKPYLNAAYKGGAGTQVNNVIEKYVAKLGPAEKAALDAYKEAKLKGWGPIKTNKLVKMKAGYEPSASAKTKLKQAADYEIAKSGGVAAKSAGYSSSSSSSYGSSAPNVPMVPARPAISPRDGLPPPPRFSEEQRERGVRRYGSMSDGSIASAINAEQKRLGLPEVTRAEAAAIRSYTGSAYQAVNRSLRDGAYQSNHELQAFVEAAQHGLAKMPKHVGLSSRGLTLHGTDLTNMLSSYRKGAIVEDSAFVSSSRGETAAFSGNVYMKINGRNGVLVERYSKYQREREVLFMPGTLFRVDSVEQINGKYIVTMTEV